MTDTSTLAGPSRRPAGARPGTIAPTADVGLLVVRLGVGLLLAGHGLQKLFGWFGGNGLDATARSFERLGYSPGHFFAGLAGLSETGGGILLALGLFTPLGAAMVTGTMVNAVSAHWSNGLWATDGGFEYPLMLAVVAAGLGFTGPGSLALDRGRPWGLGGPRLGLAALGLALVTSAIALVIKYL